MPAPNLLVNGRPAPAGWLAGAVLVAVVVGLIVLATHRSSTRSSSAALAPASTHALPDFEVKPVATSEGEATWYDVPPDSLPQRRAWPGELTAASDRLPPDAYVRVRRIDSRGDLEKTVVVRITDDGVHNKNTVVDLNRPAAEALGMVKAGRVRVRVEVLALKNATTDKPVEKKGAPTVAPKTTELTDRPAATEKQEKDAAAAKAQP